MTKKFREILNYKKQTTHPYQRHDHGYVTASLKAKKALEKEPGNWITAPYGNPDAASGDVKTFDREANRFGNPPDLSYTGAGNAFATDKIDRKAWSTDDRQADNSEPLEYDEETELDESEKRLYSQHHVHSIVDKFHVSTPDKNIVDEINRRTKDWGKPTQSKMAVKDALKRHSKNKDLYYAVQSGDFNEETELDETKIPAVVAGTEEHLKHRRYLELLRKKRKNKFLLKFGEETVAEGDVLSFPGKAVAHQHKAACAAEYHHQQCLHHKDRAEATQMFSTEGGGTEHHFHNRLAMAHATARDIHNTINDLYQRSGLSGHIKEEVDEAWSNHYETPKSKKGMWDGYSLEELRKAAKTAKGKRLKEIDFAIRAKSGWGKVKEETELDEISYDKTRDYYNKANDQDFALTRKYNAKLYGGLGKGTPEMKKTISKRRAGMDLAYGKC